MTAELGLFCLILAFCLSCVLSTLPLAGTYWHVDRWQRAAIPLSLLVFAFTAISFALLTRCFLQDDFSVAYVARNSNTQLPDYYKISAVWGAHEGSLLLWSLILTLWIVAVALFARRWPQTLHVRTLSVLGMIATGFFAFMLFTSNPFARELPFPPAEGADLNPLLQDIGLIVHPPMLYCGYVGFAVPFAIAIAMLLAGRLDDDWTRRMRPWVNVAWAFLSIGIALGSWWAYYELGWGGWWFWDPVENASFMPWLAGTALLHTLSASDKRQLFPGWTLLLAILAFSLSLLGTFLVRSGVLTSVHAFASDPTRGLFILGFLTLVVGGSLTLFAWRSPATVTSHYPVFSRETGLLANSVLLALLLAVVVLGTLYPLIADALSLGKISVGPPYFNRFFFPLMGCLLLVLPLGITLQWQDSHGAQPALLWLRKPATLAIIGSPLLLLALAIPFSALALLGSGLGLWVVTATLHDILHKLRHARGIWHGVRALRPSYWGMCIAHFGLAVSALGIVFVSLASEQRDLRLAPQQQVDLAGYHIVFEQVESHAGPNFLAQRGLFSVHTGDTTRLLYPEKRQYLASRKVMTEAAIWPGLSRDVYISLGEPLQPDIGAASAWSVRVHVKPAVRWIWLGAILMALGAIMAACDKRYRLSQTKKADT